MRWRQVSSTCLARNDQKGCICGFRHMHRRASPSQVSSLAFIPSCCLPHPGDLDRLHAALESDPLLSLAPCLLAHGEAVNLLPQVMSIPSDWEEQRSVAFVYATCWPGTASELPALSETLASCLAEGSRVITIDKQLVSSTIGEWAWVPLCAPIERPNRDTHTSLGYAYELKRCAAAAAVAADEERRRGMLN
mmetsp:Transcript_13451/g.40798  ORF Transcript_13451/g.40798 Transcript_13451/m.40798 type:complete len:192 (-) Transcript_13451:769-1344(-)